MPGRFLNKQISASGLCTDIFSASAPFVLYFLLNNFPKLLYFNMNVILFACVSSSLCCDNYYCLHYYCLHYYCLTGSHQTTRLTVFKYNTMVSGTIQTLHLRLDLIERISYDSKLLWRIDNFRNRQHEAVAGIQKSILFAPFYTSHQIYKMCLINTRCR